MSSSLRLDPNLWKDKDSSKTALVLSAVLFIGALGAGFASKSDSLLDMINDGATLAVAPVDPTQLPPLEIELTEPPPPPPPEPAPEFIKPEEIPKVVEIPKPVPEPVKPVPVPKAAPVQTPAPKVQYAAAPVVMGNKNFPRPLYPMEAKIRKFEGTVVVAIEVVAGKIASVYVVSSSGYGLLDSSSVSFIKRNWKFPDGTTRNVTVPVQYSLDT